MLRLHYFSNLVALQLPDQDEEVYRLDQIKEFESVDPAWKEVLSEYLLQGICFVLFSKCQIRLLYNIKMY